MALSRRIVRRCPLLQLPWLTPEVTVFLQSQTLQQDTELQSWFFLLPDPPNPRSNPSPSALAKMLHRTLSAQWLFPQSPVASTQQTPTAPSTPLLPAPCLIFVLLMGTRALSPCLGPNLDSTQGLPSGSFSAKLGCNLAFKPNCLPAVSLDCSDFRIEVSH